MSAPPTALAPPCTAIVLAAGSGRRFGDALPKQYHTIHGLPLIVHTLTRMLAHPLIARVVPVIAPDGTALWADLAAPHLRGLAKLAPPVTGGAQRQDSVWLGLSQAGVADDDWVAIHDGARPAFTHALLDRLLAARAHADALLAALPALDTIKQANAQGQVVATLDRQTIWLGQTPQLFRAGLLRAAHRQAQADGHLGTDDASLVERLGVPVQLVEGEPQNLKVTRPEDAALAAWFLAQRHVGLPAPNPGQGLALDPPGP